MLEALDLAEDELTTPATVTADPEPLEPAEVDPLDAKVGDRLGDGSVVKRRLGRGSTALALLVDRGPDVTPSEVVCKVALGPEADGRLLDEARILDGLTYPGVVQMFDQITLAGRVVLVEALAGPQSLADELRRNGTPGVEFLQRWGVDLLDTLRYLEEKGRSHRDIKPDNLGVTEIGPNREQHLVLFDFSLAGVPSTDIRAGTPPYLDPFLADRKLKAWDLAAERYAAAVTLYEMATGETPRWGDGRSDPAFTTSEVTLDALLFDPAVRDRLEGFFATALRRDPEARFGNAEEMANAWARVFDALDVTTAPAGPASDDEVIAGGPPSDGTDRLPTTLALDDPISSLGAAGRVTSALARMDVSTIRRLATLSPVEVNRARRISPRVRRRIIELRAAVLRRFADELAETSRTIPAPTTTTSTTADGPRLDLDALLPLLVPPAPARGAKGVTQTAVRMLLGIEPVESGTIRQPDWPSQSAVAGALGVTRGRLGQIAPAARQHWAGLEALGSLRDELVELIAANGGVMTVAEIDPLIVETRGSGLPAEDAARAARAAVRAAVESEDLVPRTEGDGPAVPRFVVRRRGDRVVVAGDGDPAGDGSADLDGQALAAYAVALDDRADEMVAVQADVVPQDRAVAVLRSVAAPESIALADGRLVRLGAAASQHAGVSSALELYPLSLDPVRALRLARQGLASAARLTVDDVRDRVRARFSQVTLPDRPALDQALADAEVAVVWNVGPGDGGSGSYVRDDTSVGGLSGVTSVVRRQPTRRATGPWSVGATDADPDVQAAADLEGRLQRSLEHGGFLALRVPTSRGRELRRELARFTSEPYGVVSVDLERCFLDELRAAAADRKVSWDKLVAADAAEAGSRDHTNLRILTRAAAERVEARVLGAGARVLAWNPGVLVRYGELAIIDRLRARAGLADSDLQTLWLVVFGSTVDPKPLVDGQPVPVLGASEWLDITDVWLTNRHRHRAPTGTDALAAQGPPA